MGRRARARGQAGTDARVAPAASEGRMTAMARRKSDAQTFQALPATARFYVAAVAVAGAVCLTVAAMNVRLENAGLFAALMGIAIVTSAVKIELPLGRSQSNLSLSHAVNFLALFTLGPAQAVCIAAVSAWAQCTLRSMAKNPPHRVVFNVAVLVITVS